MKYLIATAIAGALLAAAAAPALAQVPKTGPTPNPAVSIPPALAPLVKREVFVSGGYIIPPIICNQFTGTACTTGTRYGSHYYRGAAELPLGESLTAMVKVDYRLFHYNLPASSVIVGDDEGDVRLGLRVLEPRLYLGASYLRRTNNYGIARLNALGFGLEKLPDADQTFSLYGGAYYYPNVQGVYHEFRYDLGVTLKSSTNAPVFLELGYLGDHTRNAGTSPGNENRSGPFVGIGVTIP